MNEHIIEKIYDPKKIVEAVRDCRSLYKNFYVSLVDRNSMIIAFKPYAETTDIEIDGRTIFIGFKTKSMQIDIPLDCKLFYLERSSENCLKIVNRDSDNYYVLHFETPRIKEV